MTKAKAIKLFTELKVEHNNGIIEQLYKSNIYEVYKKPSARKAKAFLLIQHKAIQFNDIAMRDSEKYFLRATPVYIYSHNCDTFSCFYLIVNKFSGKLKQVEFFTAWGHYTITERGIEK